MAPTLGRCHAVHAGGSSRLEVNMDRVALITIGEAAKRLGLNASTLRYYEDRGLVRPAGRRAGRRMFGPAKLRRLAFVHLVHRLGVPLATAGAILDEPSDAWRSAVAKQVHELEDLITRARGATPAAPLRRWHAHPDRARWNQQSVSSAQLSSECGFTDVVVRIPTAGPRCEPDPSDQPRTEPMVRLSRMCLRPATNNTMIGSVTRNDPARITPYCV